MKNRNFFNWLIIFLGVLAITSFCFTPAFAEMDDQMLSNESTDNIMVEQLDPGYEIVDEAFGERGQYTWIPIDNFTPWRSTDTYDVAGYYRYFTNAGYHWLGSGINLPSGALLNHVRVYFYDNDAEEIDVHVWRFTPTGVGISLAHAVSSGTPGYSSLYIPINYTIRNGDEYYVIYVGASNGSSNLRVGSVRLAWKRQIRTGLSHPFTDIGGLSTEFQDSIAALYQSGITTGTSSTTFSPNNYVTRGQMATFLARALGLHWDSLDGY